MAVTLRLARHGRRNRPHYRVVASEKGSKRDGRFIEILGLYNPLVSPPLLTLKEDKIRKWIGVGAKPTQLVSSLISKSIPGLVAERGTHRKNKIIQTRRKRKERARARATK